MTRNRLCIVASLFLTALALIAVTVPSFAQDHDRDRDHDQFRDHDERRGQFGDRDHNRNSILILSWERVAVDFGGGDGGRPSQDAQCEPGFVAVAFHVQTGEFYNQAWLDCAPMRSDGSLGDERRATARTGSPGGRPVYDARCTDGRALRGLRGRTGASIDEAAGECSYVREIAQRYDNPPTEMTESIARPRPGGHPAQGECPAGFVVTGFRSMSGEYMDHLWLLCSELRRTY